MRAARPLDHEIGLRVRPVLELQEELLHPGVGGAVFPPVAQPLPAPAHVVADGVEACLRPLA